MSGFSFCKYLIVMVILCLISIPTHAQNLLINGDFEEGAIEGFDVNGNGYNQLFPPFDGTTYPGDFAFVSNPQAMNTNFFIEGGDHTTGNGLMLAFDGNNVGGQQRFWSAGDGGTGLCCLQPGTSYRFSYWIKSIATSVNNPATQANIGIQITNANNVTLTSGFAQAPLPANGWQQVIYTFVATDNCVSIELWNNNTNAVGNDFAIDDMLLVSLDDPLDATFSVIDLNCPQDDTGFVGIYPLGGVPPFVFTITKPGFFEQNGTGIFDELAAGEYLVEVTDDVGNKISFLVEILKPDDLLNVSPNQTICFGEVTTIQAFTDFDVTWSSNPEDDSIVDLGDNTLQVSPTETTFYQAEIEYDVEIDVIYNGDFTEGNEGFISDYTYLDNNPSGDQGAYGVVQNASTWFAPFEDCTAQTGTDFLVADGATDDNCKDKLWCQSVFVIPGQEYEFIYWIEALNDNDINPANIVVEVNGNIIGEDSSPNIGCDWQERNYIWNSTGTVAEVCIYNTEKEPEGNDFGIDNIQFLTTQTCIETKRVRVGIENCFCPEIENPQGEQTICQNEALSPISVDIVLEDFQDEISFVYFTTPQVGTEMYQGGVLLGEQLATDTATYNFPPLGQLNSLPNIPGTYYVYAILSNLPANVNCRPYAEIIITIDELFTPVFDIPEQVCVNDFFTLPSISTNDIEGVWSPTDEVQTTGTYTFTPDSDLCIATIEVDITAVPDEEPEFDLPTNICSDGFVDFPTVSDNGYQGTWSPAFNPNEDTTYTFTPLEGECTELTYSTTIVIEEIVFNDELTPLEECDNNNDGFFAEFDLASRVDEVTFGNPDLEVTFHLTQNDAITGINPVSVPYSNVNPSQQTLYVRVEKPENNCYKTTTLELLVYDSPLLEDIEPLVLCDTFEVGINFFDLTSIEENLFVPGQDTTDFEISYHVSENGANNNTGQINTPTDYLMEVNPQTVYVRVSDPNSPLNCYNIKPFELIVNPLPPITPPDLIAVCDDESTGEDTPFETAIFDLSQKIPEITNNDNELDVVFYESVEDQNNDIPISDIEAYQNTANPQNIAISVTDPDNGCVATTFLTLIVDPLPAIPEPEPLVVCDADNEGTSEFDLLAAIEDILDNEVNTQITFHLTEAEAINGDNAIPIEDDEGNSILYQNLNPFNQTLYIRAENVGNANINGTGCFVTRALELEVRESPIIQELEDLVICDDDTLNGFAAFNLTENTANAIGNQDGDILNVTYHKTQAQAEAGTNAIAVPSNFTNDTNPQTIYVRIEDEETECIDLFGFAGDNSFAISVEPYPDLIAPTLLKVCNTQANPDADFPTGNFDLTSKEEEMTGLSPIPANISFTYYESQTDVDNQENEIVDPTDYINSTNPPMSIFVEATDNDTENQCSNVIAMIIDVLPYPFPVELTPEERRFIACDDDNDGVAAEPFDLTQIGQQITGSENNVGSYYLSESGAFNEEGSEEILNPTAYVNDPSLNELDEDFFPTNTQIIWLRLDSNAAGNFCFVVVPIELIVEPIPEINPAGSPFGFTLCEGDPTELPSPEEIAFSLYDLTDGSPADIIPVLDPNIDNQDQANYEFSFHLIEEDAEEGINPLGPGYQAADGEILYLRVTHLLTECYNIDDIAEVIITIEPRPEITDDDISPIVVCADEQEDDASQAENQEVATVDLTQKDEAIDPNFNDEDSNTIVEYYASEEDYTNGIAIEDPNSFTTTESPTVIFAEVINLENFCSSLTSQSFEVFVNPIPLVDISDWDGTIICVDPQTGEIIDADFPLPVLDTGLNEEDYSFEWSLNGSPLAFSGSALPVETAGVYTVTVTDLTNNLTSCQATSSAEIIQSNAPQFDVVVLSLSFDGSHRVEITNIQGDGNYEFSIDNGPWISLEDGEQSIIFTNLEAGSRIIRGRDIGGCGEVQIPVSLIDYPRYFTPNEDGYNDTWNIIGLANQRNAEIFIFDRFGKMLKQLSPSGPGWDGTYNGKPMIGNDYWFSVHYDEPSTGERKKFRANFTLKR